MRLVLVRAVVCFAALCCVANALSFGAPIVTFYTDQSAFLAATASHTTQTFEGLISPDTNLGLPNTYHLAGVTYQAFDYPISTPANRHLVLAGGNASVSGGPLSSAAILPDSSSSTIKATVDDAQTTAVGGIMMNTDQFDICTLTLTGASGILDQRQLLVSGDGRNLVHTFYGYTVSGDTITSISLGTIGAPLFDDLSYGIAATPEPASIALIALLPIALRRSPPIITSTVSDIVRTLVERP